MSTPPTPRAGLRRQDWAFVATLLGAAGAVTSALVCSPMAVPVGCAAASVVAAALGRRWSRLYPAPMPHAMRWILYLAHPGLSYRKLHRVIGARPGMRVLEIGPGVGHHALPTARRIAPGGQLDALDIQPEMLRDLQLRAEASGLKTIVTQVGDALRLPYEDATFDAAYLITVLGEIPHPEKALRELGRVVKPGGPIAVGEIFLDPDYVSPARMTQLAADAGLVFAHQAGSSLAYFARLEVPRV